MRGRGASGPRQRPVALGGDDSEGGGREIEDSDFDNSRRMLAIDLLEALEDLSEEEREAVELLFFHGCTQPEAAQIVGVHEDTIKRRWSKARIKLTGKLAMFAPTA
jgi:RNA polymerase sigma factor (sigma-70 family)